MTERLDATVRGVVQGVGYRWFVVRQAARLGLHGWAANAADGSVRVIAEGPAAALDELLGQLREGPAGARVASVDEHREPPTGKFERFAIRSAAHPGD